MCEVRVDFACLQIRSAAAASGAEIIAIHAHGHFHILTFSQHFLGWGGSGNTAQRIVIINQWRDSLMCQGYERRRSLSRRQWDMSLWRCCCCWLSLNTRKDAGCREESILEAEETGSGMIATKITMSLANVENRRIFIVNGNYMFANKV